MLLKRQINEQSIPGLLSHFQELDQILRGGGLKGGKWKLPHKSGPKPLYFPQGKPRPHMLDPRTYLSILFQLWTIIQSVYTQVTLLSEHQHFQPQNREHLLQGKSVSLVKKKQNKPKHLSKQRIYMYGSGIQMSQSQSSSAQAHLKWEQKKGWAGGAGNRGDPRGRKMVSSGFLWGKETRMDPGACRHPLSTAFLL